MTETRNLGLKFEKNRQNVRFLLENLSNQPKVSWPALYAIHRRMASLLIYHIRRV